MRSALLAAALADRRASVAPVSPSALGGKLLAWWDANDSALITRDGSDRVSSWKDSVAAYDLVQATDANKPIYSATSFNGAPGVSANGTTQVLSLESVSLPSGANACEIWALVDQAAPVSDVTVRMAFGYGGISALLARAVARSIQNNVNIGVVRVGNGTTTAQVVAPGDFSGRKVLRAQIGGTETLAAIGKAPAGSAPVVPSTGTNRTRMFASTANTPASYWQGQVAAIVVTQALTASEAAGLRAWLMART